MFKIAYCGTKGAFSHEAATKMFPDSEYVGCNTFNDAIKMADNNEVDYAVIPIENSSAGRVADVHNILPTVKLSIVKEYILPVVHNLYSADSSINMDDISIVESHPQAIMQCSNFLSMELKDVTRELSSNTAISAKELKRNGAHKAVICSKLAGEIYNLHLLKAGIQDSDDNHTTFVAFGKKPISTTFSNPITSIIFTLHNEAGSIYNALGCFAENNVNLIKIESYIVGGRQSTNSKFFLTFHGSVNDTNPGKALEKLSSIAQDVKILGSYESDNKRFE